MLRNTQADGGELTPFELHGMQPVLGVMNDLRRTGGHLTRLAAGGRPLGIPELCRTKASGSCARAGVERCLLQPGARSIRQRGGSAT